MKATKTLAAVFLLTLATIQHVEATTNYVLKLSSSADYVQVPDSNSLDLISSFTLEAWINPSRIVNQEQAVISKPRMPTGTGVELRTFGKGASLGVNDDPGNNRGINLVFGGGTTLELNTWHHIAATYDGTIGKVYIDGLLVASNRFSLKLLNGSVPLTIGQKNPPGGPLVPSFLGLIDEVRVWNRALSQAEIQLQMSLRLTGQEPGLVGYWNFDDRTAKDSSVFHNDGALVGGAQFVEEPLVLLQIFRAVEILSLSGSAAATYQLQFKTNVQSSAWINYGQPFAGGQTMQFFDTTRDSGQKVYRAIRIR